MFRIALIVVGSPISIRRKQHETRKSWVLSNYNGPYFGIRGGQLHLPRTYFNVSFSLSLPLSLSLKYLPTAVCDATRIITCYNQDARQLER